VTNPSTNKLELTLCIIYIPPNRRISSKISGGDTMLFPLIALFAIRLPVIAPAAIKLPLICPATILFARMALSAILFPVIAEFASLLLPTLIVMIVYLLLCYACFNINIPEPPAPPSAVPPVTGLTASRLPPPPPPVATPPEVGGVFAVGPLP
jgi:hypothetical protein